MRNAKLFRLTYIGIAIVITMIMLLSFASPSTVVEESSYSEQEEATIQSMDVDGSGIVTYAVSLPEGGCGRSLEFLSSHQLVEVYDQNQLIYKVGVHTSIFGRTPGTQVNYVRLGDHMKSLRIIFTPIYPELKATNTKFYVGNGVRDYKGVIARALPSAVICFCCVLAGIFSILFFVILGRDIPRFSFILYFGMFVTAMGLWLLNETQFMAAVISNRGAASVVSYLCLSMIPVPFILFHQRFLRLPATWYSRLCCDYAVVCMLGRLMLHISGIMEFRRTNTAGMVALILAVFYVIVATILHIYQEGLDKVAGLCIFAVIALFVTLGNNLLRFLDGAMQADFAGRTFLLVYIIYMLVIIGKDIKQQLQENERMNFYKELAVTDIMTGFRNRVSYEGWEQSVQDYEDIMYVLVDLNDLKYCNDTFGHSAGDQYIRDASQIIKEVFGGIGECYRIGGDEFCIIIGKSKEIDVDDYIAQMRDKEEEYNKTSVTVQIHMAVGYSSFRPYDESFARTKKRADEDMYKNKAKIKATYGTNL